MKTKKIISLIALFAVTLTILIGCAADPIQADLDNYFENQTKDVFALEITVLNSLNSVTGENAPDNVTLAKKLEEEILVNSNSLLEKAKAITVQTEELRAIHEKYILALTTQNEAIKLLLSAAENDDFDGATVANTKLIESNTQNTLYKTEMNTFAKDYGWKID